METLPKEQRSQLARCTTPHSAMRALAPNDAPHGVLEALQRQTAQLMGAALELEEEIQKEEAQHQAQLAAIHEEHRAQKKRGKLRLLAHWAPDRVSQLQAEVQLRRRGESPGQRRRGRSAG
ncbi:unnamed protein product [Effrenium voratum]|nr:unnamed protein product [Effrenium voratum]